LKPNTDHEHPGGKVGEFFSNLGPGLITGAADDDPSGISTYSVAGAAFGYLPLWMALFSFPLTAALQLMCARLGLVTGRGLAGSIRRYYPRWVLWGACSLLVVANVFNIGADLGGMAAATALVTGIKSFYWTPIYTVVIILVLIFSSYRLIAKIFKWLTLVLFSYILTAFLAKPDWGAVLHATFIPQVIWSSAFLAAFVGIIGTTISPYLFFCRPPRKSMKSGPKAGQRSPGAREQRMRNCALHGLTSWSGCSFPTW
jgi:NRAMP (natural resistance-associated macrophage protein)-like metal ion transporter